LPRGFLPPPGPAPPGPPPAGAGRPPPPGGASVTLRRLVEEARRAGEGRDRLRQAQEAAYRFMAAMAGDRPGFEEAARALFAPDRDRFAALTEAWPADIRDHARRLAAAAFDAPQSV
ncbi:DUF2239 family protein, partial [Inquilinus sp. OTU3971]|uniref:DUF2239 family protein n=1 Tax=Inquilinus sp. OTU3971 TaxID=3043855 RepID=UPI00313E21B9